MCDTLSNKQHERGEGVNMKTVGLEEQTRTEAESVLYQIECEDYETALQIAYDLCAKLRTLTSK
jgi:hypothetical protein